MVNCFIIILKKITNLGGEKMSNILVTVPYNDYNKLLSDSEDKRSIIQLLNTEFPDDTCQLIAIKSVLGVTDEETSDEDTTV